MIFVLFQKIMEMDLAVFNYIQQNLKNPFLDILMPIITDLGNWTWFLITGWLALFILGGKRGRLVCITAIIAILVVDNLTSYVIKPFFGRVRPNVLLEMSSIGELSRAYSPSFPSNHAANIFTLAMILSWGYRKFLVLWFGIAVIVGFSRIYIGAHYPLDVIAGAIVGMSCAIFFIWLNNYILKHLKRRRILC